MSDAQSLLDKIKSQNRERQRAFYLRNKEKVNEKRRELYKAGRETLKKVQVVDQPLAKVDEPIVESVTKEIVSKPSKPTKSNKKVVTYGDAVEKLKELNISSGTLNVYKNDLQRFVNITGCQDISKCLNKHKIIIKDINDATMKNGQQYSNNTIKGIYQSILFVIDNLNLKVKKEPYAHEFEIRKMKSANDNKEKIENENVLPFKDYLIKVREKFGEDSKMFLIASLYNELTIRDDFQLKIISNHKDAVDDKVNYILVPKIMACKITINTYKTDKKYGVITHTCSKPLSNLIKVYLLVNGLKDGDYLFGNKPLTQFVSSNNPKIGIQGGVNYFRHMKITDEVKDITSVEERKALADKMRHSPNTQLAYMRKHKLI